MSMITWMRKEKAVYWQKTGVDHYGNASFASPVEISCRWESKSEEFKDARGEITRYDHTVYVDRDMALGDMLKQGAMDSNESEDPTTDSAALSVQRFEKFPDLRALEYLRTVYL